MRVVSLVPAATEILCALGLGDQIVGISHDCDFPAEVINRPRLTRTRLTSDLSSYEIDREVRASVASGHSLYAIQAELLEALRPDLVITQGQCSVCAVDRGRTICALESLKLQTRSLSLAASDFSGLYRDILAVGTATSRSRQAETLVVSLQERISRIVAKTSRLCSPRVFCLSWFDPLMAAGNWIAQMVKLAGGDPRLGGEGKASSRVLIQQVQSESPEIVFLLPCSFSQTQTGKEWIRLRDSLPWSHLPAVRNGRVFALASHLFHRPGPRLVDGVELLAALTHPSRCAFSAATDFSQRVA